MSQDLQHQQSRDDARQSILAEPDKPPAQPDQHRELTAVSLAQLEKAVRAWRRERGLNRKR